MNDNPQQQQKPPGLRALLQSVLAAALGVQSSKNRERDFTDGKASHWHCIYVPFYRDCCHHRQPRNNPVVISVATALGRKTPF
jgi:hypothetical protein